MAAVNTAFGGPRQRHLAIATIVLLVLYASSMLVPRGYNVVIDAGVYNTLQCASAMLCWFNVKRATSRSARWQWALITAAMTSFALGDIVWSLFYANRDVLPFPSWSDFFWLGYYPFMYASIVVYMRSIRAPRSVWLDGLVGGLGAAALAAAVAFGPISRSALGGTFGVTVNMAYPLGDMLLMGFVLCSFALLRWRPGREMWLMGGGFLVFAVGDTLFLFLIAKFDFHDGTLLDVTWPLGMLLVALAGQWGSRPAPEYATADLADRLSRWASLVVPVVSVGATLALLLVGQFRRLPLAAVLLGGGCLVTGFVRLTLTFREITALARSRHEARTDELTELGNRRYFYEEARRMFESRAVDDGAALLVIDLDRFKEVNDTLGHHVGDELLRKVGPRLRTVIRKGDIVARLGGDEFVILLDGADHETAITVAHRVREMMTEPFNLDGIAVHIDASVGVSMFPDHGRDVDSLLQRADVAMYQAKSAGGGHEVYVAERDRNSRKRLELIDELRIGIATGQLIVHYQPKVDGATGLICGVEALVRWQHPERGVLMPDVFLGLAEECGLIRDLTLAVLDRALHDSMVWAVSGVRTSVAVNLSVTNLLDSKFVLDVDRALRRTGADPEYLMFEITENLILADPQKARETVTALRSRGIRISLDDYGTGYSSLAYLRQLPFDELKLDRSFVTALEHDPTAATFVSTARELAHALNLRLVAEGIESAHVWDIARRAGCDIGQGHYFSKPLPGDEILEHLTVFGAGSYSPASR